MTRRNFPSSIFLGKIHTDLSQPRPLSFLFFISFSLLLRFLFYPFFRRTEMRDLYTSVGLSVGFHLVVRSEVLTASVNQRDTDHKTIKKIFMLYRFGWIIKCYVSLSNPPHPTAQTTYGRDMKFGMESQWGNTFWAIRGFFQFPPLSRDMGVGRCNP